MKGIVFTEFIEMVEDRFSFETSERLLEASDLPSGGIYTSVGTYSHEEMTTLVSNLSSMVGPSVPDLLKDFGRHLFKRFLVSFPAFFEGIGSTFEFLPKVDSYVHLEVKKLYPDAETPSFTCDMPEQGLMIMTYRSTRNLADLAEGLILACGDHFKENLTVTRETRGETFPMTSFIISKS